MTEDNIIKLNPATSSTETATNPSSPAGSTGIPEFPFETLTNGTDVGEFLTYVTQEIFKSSYGYLKSVNDFILTHRNSQSLYADPSANRNSLELPIALCVSLATATNSSIEDLYGYLGVNYQLGKPFTIFDAIENLTTFVRHYHIIISSAMLIQEDKLVELADLGKGEAIIAEQTADFLKSSAFDASIVTNLLRNLQERVTKADPKALLDIAAVDAYQPNAFITIPSALTTSTPAINQANFTREREREQAQAKAPEADSE